MVPIYEKLLELVVQGQIRNYTESNNILTSYQAGFRKQNSCESAIQTVLSKWKDALENKKVIGVVFLDFRRAFETVNRTLLIQKLKKYGIGGTVIKWMEEYLENRTQQTKFNYSVSPPKDTKHGVPQGTVLGPDLFVLYINDIVNHITNCNIQLFADDTLIYFTGDATQDVIEVLNNELRIIQKWLECNSLSLNTSKTKFMIIKGRHNVVHTRNHTGLIINGQSIEQVHEHKYLGVIIDQNLTFSSHANHITKKIAKKVNLLSRISKNLSYWTKLLIYKSIILPHFNFCPTILFMLNNNQINTLQKKQNRALRCILNCNRYTSIKCMLEATSMLSVSQHIFYSTMLFIYKMKTGMCPEHLCSELKYVSEVHNYNTRVKNNFYVKTVSTNFSQNNLFNNGLVKFNSLPLPIKSCESLGIFKKLCKKYCNENIDI